jgi:hypothetical protein
MTSSTYAKFLRRLNKKTKYNQHERSIELKNEEEMTEEEFHEEIAGMDEEALEALLEAIEGDETLDEVSKERLASYVVKSVTSHAKNRKAYNDASEKRYNRGNSMRRVAKQGPEEGESKERHAERVATLKRGREKADSAMKHASNKLANRTLGLSRAGDRLAKEEFSLEDVVAAAVSKKPVDFREMVEALIESKVAAAIDGYVETAFEAFIVPEEQIDEAKFKLKNRPGHNPNATPTEYSAGGDKLKKSGDKAWNAAHRKKTVNSLVNKNSKTVKEDEDLDIDEVIESLTDDQVEEVLAELEALDLDGLSEEEIAEVSKERLGAYIKKAKTDNALIFTGKKKDGKVRHIDNAIDKLAAKNEKSKNHRAFEFGIAKLIKK